MYKLKMLEHLINIVTCIIHKLLIYALQSIESTMEAKQGIIMAQNRKIIFGTAVL